MAFFLGILLLSLIGACGGYFRQGFSRGFEQVARMHQVPCNRCAYFTGDYNLKCTVNPYRALTEEAISCRDFERATSPNQLIVPSK
jgi:hypothetical protein